MKIKLHMLWLLCLLIASLASAILAYNFAAKTSYPAETISNGSGKKEKTIELENLVKIFLPYDVDSDVTNQGWDMGGDGDSAITWLHDGIELTNTAFQRRGEVVPTVDGVPTYHLLRKNKELGKWSVLLEGPRAGVTHVTLEMNANSQEWDGQFLLFQVSGVNFKKIKCLDEFVSWGNVLYEATWGSTKAYVVEGWSCGSGGCSSTLDIYYGNQPPKLVCAVR
jgi:hypothetical protein